MLKKLIWVFLVLFCAQASAQQSPPPEEQSRSSSTNSSAASDANYHITDELYTFMHAGPGRNYRILGSVTAGTKVRILQRSDEEQFIEVIDDKERTGWVDARFVVNTTSLREQVPELEEKLQSAQGQLSSYQTDNDRLSQRLATLQEDNQRLTQQLTELQQAHEQANTALNQRDQSVEQEWFLRGGIIALAGIILGVILTYLPKKRRRSDNWM